jgi:hypothetical protein
MRHQHMQEHLADLPLPNQVGPQTIRLLHTVPAVCTLLCQSLISSCTYCTVSTTCSEVLASFCRVMWPRRQWKRWCLMMSVSCGSAVRHTNRQLPRSAAVLGWRCLMNAHASTAITTTL